MIHIPERSENTLLVGGRELWFDPTWREQETKKLGGVVVAAPAQLGDTYLLSRQGFAPGRVAVSAIQDELSVGDYAYVDWSVTEAHLELPGVGGVYKALVNQVVARVREGRLEPYGSYVFLREVFPDDVEAVEVLGKTLRLRVSGSGLTMGTEDVPAVPYQGVVTHVGWPLRGQPGRVQVGDRVVLDKAMCGADKRPLKMKMAGVEYLCIRQDYIAAVLTEVQYGPGLRWERGDVDRAKRLGWPGEADEWFTQQRVAARLVTTCCGADYFQAMAEDRTFTVDYCQCCKQVAHLVPVTEFSQSPPAA